MGVMKTRLAPQRVEEDIWLVGKPVLRAEHANGASGEYDKHPRLVRQLQDLRHRRGLLEEMVAVGPQDAVDGRK